MFDHFYRTVFGWFRQKFTFFEKQYKFFKLLVMPIEEGRERQGGCWRHICANRTQLIRLYRWGVTTGKWLYWRSGATPPHLQSGQLCSIGADMTSATSLSFSIYNLLLYGHAYVRVNPFSRLKRVREVFCSVPLFEEPSTNSRLPIHEAGKSSKISYYSPFQFNLSGT